MEGLYSGTASSGYEFGVVALDSGEIWGIYLKNGVVYAAVHGSSSVSGGAFSGSGFDFNLASATRTSTNFSGTFVSSSSVSGTLTPSGVAFNGTFDPTYNTAASLSSVTGAWSGPVASELGVQTSSVTVASDGSFQGSVSTCSYAGTFVPRPGGKNVFNLSVKFNSASCLFYGQTLAGIAMVRSGQLITLALLADGTKGFMALAQRP